MDINTYPIVVVRLDDAEGGGFLALAPDLLGCMGDGETQEAAVSDLRNAIAEWIDEAQSSGMDIPMPGSRSAAARQEIDDLVNLIGEQNEAIERLEEQVQHLRAAAQQVIGRRGSESRLRREHVELIADVQIVAFTDRTLSTPH